MIKAIFLDRDGTLVKDYPDQQWVEINELEIYPDTLEALKKVPKEYKLFIVTNQYLIDEKIITFEKFLRNHKKFVNLLRVNGIVVDQTYYCPHARTMNCHCIKPNKGMIEQCLLNYDIDLGSSFLIGNSEADIKLAKNINCRSILVRDEVSTVQPTFKSKNLEEAVNLVLENTHRG